MKLPKPVTREDAYLSFLNGVGTFKDLPTPITRQEKYLHTLCLNGGTGGGGSNVTLDGVPQSNFNFIGNGVVPDGLLDTLFKSDILNSAIVKDVPKISSVYCEVMFNDLSQTYSGVFSTVNVTSSLNGFGLYVRSTKKLWVTYSNSTGRYNGETSLSCKIGKKYLISTTYDGTTLKIFANGINVFDNVVNIDTGTSKIAYGSMFFGSPTNNVLNGHITAISYNRQLTPQEIAHNFSVLNNSPSTNQLHVTNSDDQTSILSLGSTGNHVEMATGRTLEEEYMGVLDGMSQEYSSNGEAITVNDGLKARLVGAEITGNTKILDADGNECEAGTEGARLVSTEATIMNNGVPYKFYASEEDKANQKQILLGGTATKKDTLTLNTDGSLVWTQNTKDADDGSSRVNLATPITQTVDKSINNTTILTDQSNILSVDSPVGASEFKVKVPMDLAKTYGDRLTQVENIINTGRNTQLLANYADDTYDKIIKGEVN